MFSSFFSAFVDFSSSILLSFDDGRFAAFCGLSPVVGVLEVVILLIEVGDKEVEDIEEDGGGDKEVGDMEDEMITLE